jgi:CelD/BcsL family acetyltransferase involved in cellulose biosynthesis
MVKSLAKLGYLRAYLLLGRGDPIAYLLAATHHGCCLLIAQSYLPDHRELQPGNFLLRRVLEYAAEEGAHTFDFGFGNGQQKSGYGTHSIEELTCGFYGRSTRASTAWAINRFTGSTGTQARRLLQKLRLAGSLKRRWRSRLEQHSDR